MRAVGSLHLGGGERQGHGQKQVISDSKGWKGTPRQKPGRGGQPKPSKANWVLGWVSQD